MEFRFKLEKSDLITPIVLNLCDNVNQLLKANKKEGNTINLSNLQWVSPLSILPLSSLLFNLKNKGYKLNIIEPSNLVVIMKVGKRKCFLTFLVIGKEQLFC